MASVIKKAVKKKKVKKLSKKLTKKEINEQWGKCVWHLVEDTQVISYEVNEFHDNNFDTAFDECIECSELVELYDLIIDGRRDLRRLEKFVKQIPFHDNEGLLFLYADFSYMLMDVDKLKKTFFTISRNEIEKLLKLIIRGCDDILEIWDID